MTEVTRILNAIEGGDAEAINALLPVVYEELRTLAAQKLAHERPGHTLATSKGTQAHDLNVSWPAGIFTPVG